MLKNIIALVGLASIVIAGDFEKGMDAYTKKQYTSAVKFFNKACDSGNAKGCFQLGKTYELGHGHNIDIVKATHLYQKACDKGYECKYLAGKYAYGDGGFQIDMAKSADLFSKACNDGDALGCNMAGMAYGDGFGVQADDFKAAEFYARACRLEDGLGCNSLALTYYKHNDYTNAKIFFKKSCSLKESLGCKHLTTFFGE